MPACFALLLATHKRVRTASIVHGARGFSTATGQEQRRALPLAAPSVCVWGANTGVGKTLISAGLAAAAVRAQCRVLYVKPVQTGYPADSDARLVEGICAAAAAAGTSRQGSGAAPSFASRVLHTYCDPVSPHLAAATEGRVIPDAALVADTLAQLQAFAVGLPAGAPGLAVVETAGGVASPGPSGNSQGDILRPLRLPALLVGDYRLGGISTSLTAYESLLLRGHDVSAIVLMDQPRWGNAAALQHQLATAGTHRNGRPLPVITVPLCQPPDPVGAPEGTQAAAGAAAGLDANLVDWLQRSAPAFDRLLALLQQQHAQRLEALCSAAARASAGVWWPFTQHANLPDSKVTVVDARAGEEWHVLRAASAPEGSQQQQQQQPAQAAELVSLYDACGSWWTQTVNAGLQLEMSRAVASAAGRYMHVLWPENVHEPGLALTERLLASPMGAGWAGKVFYSDDGSTAIEVALKMACRKFAADQGLLERHDAPPLHIIALANGYHGDTLGAMDCAAPSPYNSRLQTPWYSGRGLFLEPPYMGQTGGRWMLQLPAWLQQAEGGSSIDQSELSWPNRESAFCPARGSAALRRLYAGAIAAALDGHEAATGARLGALLMEPVLQGAGGMLCADPEFQRALVEACRARSIPVIFDEVFTGCWRIGAPSGAALLGQAPDIACYAKLLTGGAAPLAITLASDAVFNAFKGPTKVEALLHGHSYTAYPLGCAAALASLHILAGRATNPNMAPHGWLNELWEPAAVAALSRHPLVARVVDLGCVLAVEVGSNSSGGAGSSSSSDGGGQHLYASAGRVVPEVIRGLRARGVYARPLGAVVYLMVTPTTDRGVCGQLASKLAGALDDALAAAPALGGAEGGEAVECLP